MYKSKLFPILRSFTSEELREFERYLASPFFGYKAFVLKFFRHLPKYHPHYRDEDISKEALFKKVYKNRKYNDNLVRRILSDLIRAAEDFLTLKNFKGNDIFRNACLLNELRNRGLNDSFRVRSGSILREIENSSEINAELLLNSYFVNLEIKEFKTSVRDDVMQEAYDQMAESLSVFFLRSFLSYVNHVHTFRRKGEAKDNISLSLFKAIDDRRLLKSLENYRGKLAPYVKMMLYNFKIVNNRNDVSSYKNIMKLLDDHKKYFSETELKNIYVNISKFFNYQNNLNNNRFIKETFELYELFLKEYFIPSPSLRLQLSFCRNYINASKSTGNAEKIKVFRDTYSDCFPEEHERDVELFCTAVYEFEKRNFAESLKAASEIGFQQAVIVKDVRILKIKCMYELDYIESVRTETDNFKRFLSSTKTLTPQSIKRGKHFASFVLQLLRSVNSRDPSTELALLRKKIADCGNLNETKWLNEKIVSLNK
ncbi:MAG: hypothetical protein IPG99_02500 [Ignavibacteria bacterium]|nr:hypothetical protein [Ignavibacteria bacterium]